MTDPRERSLADPSNADAGPMRVDLGHGGEVNRWAGRPDAGPNDSSLALDAGPSPGARFYLAARALWLALHDEDEVSARLLARADGWPTDALYAFLRASPSRT